MFAVTETRQKTAAFEKYCRAKKYLKEFDKTKVRSQGLYRFWYDRSLKLIATLEDRYPDFPIVYDKYYKG